MRCFRHGRLVVATLISIGGFSAKGQDVLPPLPPRSDLPFAIERDRLPGPPRVMGELPQGLTQPPSTMPGRMFNQPPSAMGDAPQTPQGGRRDFQGPMGLIPFPGFPRSGPMLDPGRSGSPIPFAVPGLSRPGQDVRNPDLPLPLPETFLTSPDASPVPRPVGGPLRLEEVLYGAERTEPRYLTAQLDRAVTGGDLLSAEGAFDLNVNADSRNYPLGYYNRSVHDIFLEQPLQTMGAKVFAGYRNGYGRYPTYYQYLQTRGGGAFVAGLELPLFKNRAIDAKRAKLRQAEIERQKAEPTVLKARVDLFKNASKAYWMWVAAGQTMFLYQELSRLAATRAQGLERQIQAGVGRPIDQVDFQRVVLFRRQQSVAAERRFQQATIELALFLRDTSGFPLLAEAPRVPSEFPVVVAPERATLDDDVQVALRLRPEIYSLRLLASKTDVERSLAQNQLLPQLNLYIYTESNFGPRAVDLGKDFRPLIAEASLMFDVPLQRRFAKGRIIAADATLRQIAEQARFLKDRIRADVQDAHTGAVAAQDLLAIYQESEALAIRLERAEAVLLEEGASNLLLVNAREQASYDARVARVDAEGKLLSSLVDYRAALGLDAIPVGKVAER